MGIFAWHFTRDTLRDGRPIPAIGEWLEHEGDVVMCESGLHASARILDALDYAPGNMIHRVECDDIVQRHKDKLVCRRRRIIATFDGEDLLRNFARFATWTVLPLWDAPDVVVAYVLSGDEKMRCAAYDAAYDAACAAARAAAYDATAFYGAYDAARDAFTLLLESQVLAHMTTATLD